MDYPQVKDGDENIEEILDENGQSYVQFDAFFLKDLTGDGIAESVRGTCKEIGVDDTLYIELNVRNKGHLKQGATITINKDRNFKFRTAIVEDNIVSQNYIGEDIEKIVLNQIDVGTQKLLQGKVISNIGNNIHNYRKENSIKFTGIYVNETGEEIPIEKEVKLQVDWHGEVKAKIADVPYYDRTPDINNAIDEENQTFTVEHTIDMYDENKQLIIKKAHIEGKIPDMNGYNPIDVKITGTDIKLTYNDDTRDFIIEKEAQVDEESGNIIKQAYGEIENGYKHNKINITIKYSLDAYKSIGEDAILTELTVSGYYEGYNIYDTTEFENPHVSEIDTNTLVRTYRSPSGYIFQCNVYIGENGVILKNKPLNIYNGISENEVDDTYNVIWNAQTGTERTKGIIMKETVTDNKYVSDQFIKKDGSLESMENITSNIGIRFRNNPENMLGENGWIKVYDDETDMLLETFTKSTWTNYISDMFRFEMPIKHIRIETSETELNESLSIICVKEIDVQTIIDNYTKEQFYELEYIKTQLEGEIEILEGTSKVKNTDVDRAEYRGPKSAMAMTTDTKVISTQKTKENVQLNLWAGYTSELWTNGVFLIKMPEHIVDVKINSITVAQEPIEDYELYEENHIIFIKIRTQIEEPRDYIIRINCDLTADPRMTTATEFIEAYGYNEIATEYRDPAKDIYDINENLNTEENVEKDTLGISLIAPGSLITSETITNYDNKDSITIAPQIAKILGTQNTADISVNIGNNYAGIIDEIMILGRVPYEGNKYAINGNDMKSSYTVTMQDTGIIVPEKLKNIAKVYYSENGEATKDLKNLDNKWTDTPEDWNEVKSYLIDLGEYKLNENDKYEFKYTIKLPEERVYEKVTYSHHAVYFSLNTTEGKYRTDTEPNKIGLEMSAPKYNLELTKYQENKEKVISGATYSIKDEQFNTKTAVTKENGILTMSGLSAGKTYTIKEIKTPEEYELNEEEIKFTVVEENVGILKGNLISGNIKGDISIIQAQEDEIAKVQIQVEDKVKANVKIVKTATGTQDYLNNVRFKITGKNYESGATKITNDKGEIEFKGLTIGEEYTLEETRAENYYLMKPIKFKVVKSEESYVANIVEPQEGLENIITINETTIESEIPTINFAIKNEAIPKYNLTIKKVEKGTEQIIEGVKFKLYKEKKEIGEYTTNDQGQVTIQNLNLYEETRKIDQTYILKEVNSTEGYSNIRDITFKVENLNGVLTMNVISGQIKEQTANDNTITITIENAPIFKLVKKDAETQEGIENVKFAIYNASNNEPAKNGKGETIGQKETINGEECYVVTTDEKGEIVESLAAGEYNVVEMQAPEQYEMGTLEERTHKFAYNIPVPTQKELKVADGENIGSNDDDSIKYVETTPDGGYVILGEYKGQSVALPDGSTLEGTDSGNYGYVIKFDQNGDIDWKKSISGTSAYGLSVTPGGAIYFKIGSTLYKYDKYGNEEWKKNITYTDIQATKDEGFVIISNNGSYMSSTKYKIYVGKFDKDGVLEWSKEEATNTNNDYRKRDERANAVTQLDDGHIVVVGTFAGREMTLSNGRSIYSKTWDDSIMANTGNANGFTIEYDENGSIWRYDSDASREYGYYDEWLDYSITNILKKGNSYMTIYTTTYVDGSRQITTHIGNHTSTGNTCTKITNDGGYIILDLADNYIYKYNSNDRLEWKTEGFAGMKDICQINDNNYVIVGEFSDEISLYNETLNSSGGKDGVISFLHETDVPIEGIPVVEELTIENNLKEFKITTAVESVNGEKGGNISGEGNDAFETVQYGKNVEGQIEMTPNEGYEIVKITINGEEQEFITEGGTYILPQITNVTENKHIVVTYMKTSNKLTIKKKDKNDNKVLAGAKFKIDQIETRQPPSEVIGSIVNNGAEYAKADTTQEVSQSVIGEMIKNGNDCMIPDIENPKEGKLGAKIDDNTWYFDQNEDGTLTSNNGMIKYPSGGSTFGHSNTTAHSYYEIDLTGYSDEDLVVVIEAKVSSSRWDYGYATITNSKTMPSYSDSNGKFMYISGETSRRSYVSQVLTKGTKNYLHLGYYKDHSGDDGDDKLTIYSVKVCGQISGKYFFEGSGTGPYTSNNAGRMNTQANTCIPINLKELSGKYHLIINAEISCESKDYSDYKNDYGYIVIKDDATIPTSSYNGNYVTGELCGIGSTTKYEKVLDGGKEYFLNFVYYKDDDNTREAGNDNFTIHSINIYKEITNTYYFEGSETGPYISNNIGIASTTANSYIPINLSTLSGTYQVTVNAEVSSSGSGDYGYAVITTTTSRPSYNSGTSVTGRIYGQQGAKNYTAVINGGYEYFLHFAYYKDSYNDSGDITDTFKINSIQVSLSDQYLYHGEATTNDKGEATIEIPIGTYEIEEIEAPFGYELENTKIEYTMKTEEENIVEVTNRKLSKVTVHHYLKGTKDELEPTKIAEDDIYRNKVGEKYTTEPHLELEEYELIKDEQGQYITPQNASGEYKENEEIVIYEYEPRKLPLVVHHYIRGTTQKVPLPNNQGEAPDVTDAQVEGTTYATEAVIPDIGYELVETPQNATGQYEYPGIEVTYYYKLKTYEITTKVKTHTEKDEYEQEIQVAGGEILGEGETPYETVEHGASNQREIKAIPEENYQVKSIEINGRQLEENEYTVDGEGVVTLNTIENITENQEIIVEFEKKSAKIIVHHYLYDAELGKTEEKAPLEGGNVAQDETKIGKIGERYVTDTVKDLDEDYRVYEIPQNSSGIINEYTINVYYYYIMKDEEVVDTISKNGTEKITKEDEEIKYTIEYTSIIKRYIGNATITIIDTLPYKLDTEKMKNMESMKEVDTTTEDWIETALDGGQYNEENQTITWTWQENEIDSLSTMEPKEITIKKNITVIFKDINKGKNSLTNQVKGKTWLEATDQTKETKTIEFETKTEFTKNIKVTKTWQHEQSTEKKPSQIILQVKNKETDTEVASYTISEENNWTHIFTGLPKYDEATGEEIEYTVEEKAVEGEEELLKYYEQK